MASTERKSAADRDLRLHNLDHFNVPVRDLNVARKFFSGILLAYCQNVVDAMLQKFQPLGRREREHPAD